MHGLRQERHQSRINKASKVKSFIIDMRKKILLIDDKASIAKVVSIYLGKELVLFGIFSVPVSCTRFAANLLTQMFMRLGRAEKAGSGVDKIVSGWQSLGWPLPTVAEETRPDYVVLTLQLGMKTRQENPQENLASRI